METIWKGKQTNKQATCVPVTKVNKQTNKQVGVACVEAWMQGVVWSCVTCRVQYAMHQSMQKSFRDVTHSPWTWIIQSPRTHLGPVTTVTSGGGTCRGMDAGGGAELHNMQSLICNASEYMEELWRCFGDGSEKHGV